MTFRQQQIFFAFLGIKSFFFLILSFFQIFVQDLRRKMIICFNHQQITLKLVKTTVDNSLVEINNYRGDSKKCLARLTGSSDDSENSVDNANLLSTKINQDCIKNVSCTFLLCDLTDCN